MFPNYSATEFSLVLGAFGIICVNIINAWKQNTKLDNIGQKAATIEGHVNSKETKYIEQITALTRENEILRSVIIDKDKTAALLAQSVLIARKAEMKQ